MSEQPQVQCPPFKIHNRTGSVQFTLKPAHFAGDTFETRDGGEVRVLKKGHLMVEMANATGQTDSRGNSVYDWANKVSMKLSDADIQQVLAGFQDRACRIVHDPNKAYGGDGGEGSLPKSCLQLSKAERFGYFMAMSRGDKKVKCPISDTDAQTFRLLLARAVARIYGW
ncbi:MAG: hypothetical protein K9L59_02575 [Desulfobacterales bacterium]|nr:hypothetical protein [Desulfobacterales bacterium]MCF8080767.1 hypothetical protein [Desulfobacterales bacterium]